MLADERASTGHLRGREVRGGAPGEEEQCARAHTSWPFWLLWPPPRSSRAKSSHEGWALGLREEMRGSALVRRVSSGWCGARGAVWSGCVRAVVQEDGRRSEGSEEEMQWRMEAVLAVRRGVVGALASGDARVRRACAAVRGGARAEAGWWRVPRRGLRASWECGCGLLGETLEGDGRWVGSLLDGVPLDQHLEDRVAELGKRSTDPDPRIFSSDHVFTAEWCKKTENFPSEPSSVR